MLSGTHSIRIDFCPDSHHCLMETLPRHALQALADAFWLPGSFTDFLRSPLTPRRLGDKYCLSLLGGPLPLAWASHLCCVCVCVTGRLVQMPVSHSAGSRWSLRCSICSTRSPLSLLLVGKCSSQEDWISTLKN